MFVRVRAPHRRMSPGGVTYVVEAAALRAVGQVLRHRRAASTAIYAKVDREALRQIARPQTARSNSVDANRARDCSQEQSSHLAAVVDAIAAETQAPRFVDPRGSALLHRASS